MYGGGWVFPKRPDVTSALDEPRPTPHTELPLSPATPTTWDAKVRRVEWVRANFTRGELAYLYKLGYDADGMRRSACDDAIRKEKAGA